MHAHADKTAKNKNQAVANMPVQMQDERQLSNQFVDNRAEAVAQRKLKDAINSSARVQQLKAYQAMADNSATGEPIQLKKSEDDRRATERNTSIQKQPNNTGLPDNLKSGIEDLSGYSMDDVKVRYNSDKPAELQAHAYAQGTDIHVAPGQERHLSHEAWHVVQQKQGRVKANIQTKGGMNINDDAELENEADTMGHRSLASRKDSTSPLNINNAPLVSTVQLVYLDDITNEADLQNNVQAAVRSGEKKGLNKTGLISTDENVNKLTPLVKTKNMDVGLYRSNIKYQSWARNVLNRIEEGAESLGGDISFWTDSIKKDAKIVDAEATHVELTGSEMHDRGLGVAMLDVRVRRKITMEEHNTMDYLVRHQDSKVEIIRVVLKPDNRSFEQALLGKNSDSIAEQLNTKADLGENSIETIGMKTTNDHGSMIEYVEDNLLTYIESWTRYLTRDKQPVIEAIAFAFITGLWDLHQENVKDKGGKPVLIDSEVGFQPKIFATQHAQNNQGIRNRNKGLEKNGTHKTVDDQLAGNNNASSLIVWAKANTGELVRILKKAIGNNMARIIPVFTDDWFDFKDRFLNNEFSSEFRALNYKESAIKDAVQALTVGRLSSPGLEAQLGKNKMGATNITLIKMEIEDDFRKGVIPEFQYQPITGRVSYHGRVIWEGENLDDSMSYLEERL